MYLPGSFREQDVGRMHALMRERPLGTLVSHGSSGLFASPVPFLVDAREDGLGVLRAHMARANPHWQILAEGGECLVLFHGEQGYVSPAWYPSKAQAGHVVPTWNYVLVEARGKAKVIEGVAWLESQVADLTRCHEGVRSAPWQLGDAPEAYLAMQLKAIVGVEIRVTALTGKWKLSQNRSEPDRNGVLAGLSDPEDAHHHAALAECMAAQPR